MSRMDAKRTTVGADQPAAKGIGLRLNSNSKTGRKALCVKILTANAPQAFIVPIRDDTGTELNWIPAGIADRCGLKRELCKSPLAFRDWQNRRFECTEFVRVRWVDKHNKTQDGVFHVKNSDGDDRELILGDEFVTANGRASDWAVEEVVGNAGILVKDKPKEAERAVEKQKKSDYEREAARLDEARRQSQGRRAGASSKSRNENGHKSSQNKTR